MVPASRQDTLQASEVPEVQGLTRLWLVGTAAMAVPLPLAQEVAAVLPPALTAVMVAQVQMDSAFRLVAELNYPLSPSFRPHGHLR